MDQTLPAPALSFTPAPDDPQRRIWLRATGVAGGIGVVATAVPFVASFEPSERAKAAGGPVEVDLSDIAPGVQKVAEWRGKPIWVVRRTPEMIAGLSGHDGELADPNSTREQQPPYAKNATRSIKPEIFVAIGICTHLGCSPSRAPKGAANPSLPADWPGGYFCPCHGSTFDNAGRVFKNKPAPSNLEIPPYDFASATRIIVGVDPKA